MSREIKFRAWDERSRYMDNDIFIHSNGTIYERASRTYDTPNMEIETVSGMIVMQWTGLKDREGTDIYEGDICMETVGFHVWHYVVKTHERFGSNLYFTVIYRNFSVNDESGEYVWEDCFVSDGRDARMDTYNIKVIGNIYSTPELLKGESK